MRLVIGTDLSEESLSAVRWGFNYAEMLRQRGQEARVKVLYVAKSRYPQAADVSSEAATPAKRKEAEKKVRNWIGEQLAVDGDYEVGVEGGVPREQLRGEVETFDADWLVVGLTGRGAWSRLVAGSTALGLSHSPPTNMAVCHPDGSLFEQTDELGVGVDFSEHSDHALELATEFASQREIRLHALHVVYPPPPIVWPEASAQVPSESSQSMDFRVEQAENRMKEHLQNFRDEHPDVDITSDILTGYAAQELKDYAEDNALDGLVLSSKGRSAAGDFFMGSVTNGLLKHAPTNVFIAPAQEE